MTDLDKELINLVKERPALYDVRLPQKNRTKFVKQSYWLEVSRELNGKLKPDVAACRWKYLRENYLKALKKEKIKEDMAKRIGITLSQNKKNSFRYFKNMEFLNDVLEYQKALALKNYTRIKPENTINSIEVTNESNVPENLKLIRITPEITPMSLHRITSNIKSDTNNVQNKKHITFMKIPPAVNISENSSSHTSTTNVQNDISKTADDYEKIFLECLQKPLEKPSPVDGFLMRLGEGLKRLPYRERAKLEIEFLSRLNEIEEQIESYEEYQ